MTNELEHNKRVLTELWLELERRRTPNNDGATSGAQSWIITIAFEKYNLLDMHAPGPGIRVPMFDEIPGYAKTQEPGPGLGINPCAEIVIKGGDCVLPVPEEDEDVVSQMPGTIGKSNIIKLFPDKL